MEHDIHVLYLILALVKFVTTGLDGIYVNETMIKICPENYWHFWLQVVWHSDKCQVSTHCSNLTSNSMKLDMAKCYNYLWLKNGIIYFLIPVLGYVKNTILLRIVCIVSPFAPPDLLGSLIHPALCPEGGPNMCHFNSLPGLPCLLSWDFGRDFQQVTKGSKKGEMGVDLFFSNIS